MKKLVVFVTFIILMCTCYLTYKTININNINNNNLVELNKKINELDNSISNEKEKINNIKIDDIKKEILEVWEKELEKIKNL